MQVHVKSSVDSVSLPNYAAEIIYRSSTHQDESTKVGTNSDLGNLLLPGLFLCFAAAYMADGKYLRKFRNELIGSLTMVTLTYGLCSWFGASMYMSWKAHSVGHLVADILGGSSDVNPAMTVALLALGYVPGDYTEAFVRIAGQAAGGLLSFLFCRLVFAPQFESLDLETGNVVRAFSAEMVGTSIYCLVLLWVTYQLHYGKVANFIIDKLGKALALKVVFALAVTGPVMNPVLAAAWDVGRRTDAFQHFFVYWIAPLLGGSLAAWMYSVYLGGSWFGHPVSVGRVRAKAHKASRKTKAKLEKHAAVDRIKSKAYGASGKGKAILASKPTPQQKKMI